jgi:cytochrome c oxidase subunit IV
MKDTTMKFISTEDPEKEYDPTIYIPETHSHGTKEVWRCFWILFLLTIADVIIYFAWQPPNTMRHITFILLGIVKAFYIVGTFMHLKYEKMNLILSIIVPMLFVIWFVAWMVFEGGKLSIIGY